MDASPTLSVERLYVSRPVMPSGHVTVSAPSAIGIWAFFGFPSEAGLGFCFECFTGALERVPVGADFGGECDAKNGPITFGKFTEGGAAVFA
jgi:hypothetical protein